jgi:hypothetical protein
MNLNNVNQNVYSAGEQMLYKLIRCYFACPTAHDIHLLHMKIYYFKDGSSTDTMLRIKSNFSYISLHIQRNENPFK